MLTEQTGVPDAALPVQAMRDHLRLGSGFADAGAQDALVLAYLRAALAAVEGRIGKALFARRFLWTLADWRTPGGQPLPVAPVVEVVSVALVDRHGVAAELAPDAWRLERDLHRPRLRPRGVALPPAPTGGRIEVTFDAGFGADWADVPADLRQAVLMLGAHYHEFRHDAAGATGAMPFGVSALVERWRTVRVLAGGGR